MVDAEACGVPPHRSGGAGHMSRVIGLLGLSARGLSRWPKAPRRRRELCPLALDPLEGSAYFPGLPASGPEVLQLSFLAEQPGCLPGLDRVLSVSS